MSQTSNSLLQQVKEKDINVSLISYPFCLTPYAIKADSKWTVASVCLFACHQEKHMQENHTPWHGIYLFTYDRYFLPHCDP